MVSYIKYLISKYLEVILSFLILSSIFLICISIHYYFLKHNTVYVKDIHSLKAYRLKEFINYFKNKIYIFIDFLLNIGTLTFFKYALIIIFINVLLYSYFAFYNFIKNLKTKMVDINIEISSFNINDIQTDFLNTSNLLNPPDSKFIEIPNFASIKYGIVGYFYTLYLYNVFRHFKNMVYSFFNFNFSPFFDNISVRLLYNDYFRPYIFKLLNLTKNYYSQMCYSFKELLIIYTPIELFLDIVYKYIGPLYKKIYYILTDNPYDLRSIACDILLIYYIFLCSRYNHNNYSKPKYDYYYIDTSKEFMRSYFCEFVEFGSKSKFIIEDVHIRCMFKMHDAIKNTPTYINKVTYTIPQYRYLLYSYHNFFGILIIGVKRIDIMDYNIRTPFPNSKLLIFLQQTITIYRGTSGRFEPENGESLLAIDYTNSESLFDIVRYRNININQNIPVKIIPKHSLVNLLYTHKIRYNMNTQIYNSKLYDQLRYYILNKFYILKRKINSSNSINKSIKLYDA